MQAASTIDSIIRQTEPMRFVVHDVSPCRSSCRRRLGPQLSCDRRQYACLLMPVAASRVIIMPRTPGPDCANRRRLRPAQFRAASPGCHTNEHKVHGETSFKTMIGSPSHPDKHPLALY
ncbi:hypothetical protein L226DRAFT_253579 [Lentinus tigrinus ALCF2SS1-7]|uniref:Uncharacterized protein n=1 Tax=Lentinus tigrinus ALCF2SS1-6 TaxID=1328759 RepID=A0A5C2RZL8_9APHY|nr:hypothetical protein L227DRAFT_253688 [Lentinus tigrinus ALCF2SS1-6]RPD79575.1 hypothetical protein L226DRAFT_253579 [Lentinus tigrinus ALCF2SS1-7]